MKPLKWEYSLTFLFGACSVVLVLLMLLANNYGQKYRDQRLQELKHVDSAGFEMQEIPSYHFSEQALEDYTDLVERPLFFKDRRPIEPEDIDDAKELKSAPVKINIVLIGIINTPEGAYALFNDPKSKVPEEKFKRFQQGDEMLGWRIKDIKYDRVVISSAQGSEEIMLAKPRVKLRSKKTRTKRALPKRTKKSRTNPFNPKK